MSSPRSESGASARVSSHMENAGSANAPAEDDGTSAAASDYCMYCQAPLQGTYCHRCGQSSQTQRLRVRELASGLVQGLFDLDSRTLRTMWHLFVRPGLMTRDYVEGARVIYLGPLRYYMLIVALNIGLSAVFGIHETHAAAAGADEGFWDTHFVAVQISLVYGGIAIPIAVGQWLLHRGSRLTLAEHYAFLLYLLAQSVLVVAGVDVFALMITGAGLEGDVDGLASLGVFTMHVIGAGRTFYREAVWHTAWKTAVSYAGVILIGVAGIGLYRLITV